MSEDAIPGITGIHLSVTVTDLEASLAWYHGSVGRCARAHCSRQATAKGLVDD
ncbi:hypothetical protein [Mycolicibacterium hippocampi]|uniref:hypothetical protein n=1 Tax=Mycolicibacterium hippocampi TaxID=659824 RepID=UPI003518B34E